MSGQFEYEYPFEEFARHFGEINATKGPLGSIHAASSRIFECLRSEFADENEFQYKAARFCLISMYLAEHMEDFKREDFAVVGSQVAGSLVGEHLLWAVHKVFATRTLAEIADGPMVAEILTLANERRCQRESSSDP